MIIDDYFDRIKNTFEEIDIVTSSQVLIEHRSPEYGKIKMRIDFMDGSMLYFMEFVKGGRTVEKYKYSYHYQNKKGEMVFRYDNSRHFARLSSFPYHKHIGQSKVVESNCPDLEDILSEILRCIIKIFD